MLRIQNARFFPPTAKRLMLYAVGTPTSSARKVFAEATIRLSFSACPPGPLRTDE